MKKSLELQQLEICSTRGALFTKEMQQRFRLGRLGFDGEYEACSWCVYYGSDNWQIICNYWFSHGNRKEIDIFIITGNSIYLIEVKNYDGHFKYENNQCYLNGRPMSEDIMVQTSENLRKIKLLAREFKQPIDVKAALVFINEHNMVEVNQEFEFDIVKRHELRQYIQNIKATDSGRIDERRYTDIIKVMNKYRCESPFQPHEFAQEMFDQLPKGITCAKCDSFETTVRRNIISCNKCGHEETKNEALLRSSKQLRYIYFYAPEMITTRNIYEFVGKSIGKSTIRKYLSKLYEKRRIGNNFYYLVEI